MAFLTVLSSPFIHVLSPLPQARVGLLPLTQCLRMPQQVPQFPRRQSCPLSRSYLALQPTIPHSSGVDGQGRRVLLWHLVWEALLCLLGLGVDHRYPFKLLFYLLGLGTPHTPQHLRKSQIAAK